MSQRTDLTPHNRPGRLRRLLVLRRRAPATAAPTHDQIAQRAYELHLATPDGDAESHWLQAERELART